MIDTNKQELTAIVGNLSLTSREKVAALRELEPTMKAIDLARLIGVSRERVRQLLLDLGQSTRSPGEWRGGGGRPRRRKRRGTRRL